MTIWLYLLRRFAVNILRVLLVFVGLGMLLGLVEDTRIASQLGGTFLDALQLTLLNLPRTMSEAFPLVMMLAALATFLGLSRTSELVIYRASGVSALRALVWPVVAAVALGIFGVVVFNPIVAATSLRAEAFEDSFRAEGQNVLSFSKDSLWLRQAIEGGQMVIQAGRVSADGVTLYGARLHAFDAEGGMTWRMEAGSAELEGGAWNLRGVTRWQLASDGGGPLPAPESFPQMRIPTELTSDQILDSFAPPETISIWQLPGFIRQLEAAGFSAVRHRVFFQTELARPAFFAAMVLIGAGFALKPMRFGQTGVMILAAIFAGFCLYFLKEITVSLGTSEAIPVPLAAWSAPAAAIMLAVAFLLHVEDG